MRIACPRPVVPSTCCVLVPYRTVARRVAVTRSGRQAGAQYRSTRTRMINRSNVSGKRRLSVEDKKNSVSFIMQ
eukprot:scaffold253215_cov17-Prasinocladus_malaysianus.AAC.1